MYNQFDEWGKDFVISLNSEGQIWGASYFLEMMDVILSNKSIDEFISKKNKNLYQKYIEETTSENKNKIKENSSQIETLQSLSEETANVNNTLNELKKDINILIQKYPDTEKQKRIKDILWNYQHTGKFEKDWAYRELTKEPQGFIAKIRNGKKIKEANQFLDAFIDKYEKLNIGDKLEQLNKDNNKYDYGLSSSLKYRFNAITEINEHNDNGFFKDYQKQIATVNEQISKLSKEIKHQEELIQIKENAFANSEKITRENNIIKKFTSEIREEIQSPKILDSKDYVEGLDKIPDDEIVMFNIGLTSNNIDGDKINNILKYNGLEAGIGEKQWFLRRETLRDNSDKGRYEIFSPLMTAKEAKGIMPKLMADFDRAHVSSGLAIPIKATEMFAKDTNLIKENISQEELQKLYYGALLNHRMQSEPQNAAHLQEKMQEFGYKSKEELPQIFTSLEDIKKQYPKEQFLFSGTTASNDYCLFSGRVGRNGISYATPDISYAAKYDGITDVGFGSGIKATGDKYVSPVIGQISGEDISVGFINIYEQNINDDKYFPNFGMEDYRIMIHRNDEPKTYDVYEPNSDGYRFADAPKQAQTATNGRLTREQAIDGYIASHTAPFEDNGKIYMPLSFNAETYITSSKNPIKAKIMHIKKGKEDFYMKIPDVPNETVQTIINNRQAKMEDTFSHSARQDILERFEKQKEQFNRGDISKVRDTDFVLKQQMTLSENIISSTDSKQQKETNTNTREINTPEKLSDKEKIAALSGRSGVKPHYATENNSATQQTIAQPTITQEENHSTHQQEKFTSMGKKEKLNFFTKLRKGINSFLVKEESQNATQAQMQKSNQSNNLAQNTDTELMKKYIEKDLGL